MNITRGLFRLCLVVSIIWIVTVGAFGWGEIKRDTAWQDRWWKNSVLAYVPVDCENARGTAATDYER